MARQRAVDPADQAQVDELAMTSTETPESDGAGRGNIAGQLRQGLQRHPFLGCASWNAGQQFLQRASQGQQHFLRCSGAVTKGKRRKAGFPFRTVVVVRHPADQL